MLVWRSFTPRRREWLEMYWTGVFNPEFKYSAFCKHVVIDGEDYVCITDSVAWGRVEKSKKGFFIIWELWEFGYATNLQTSLVFWDLGGLSHFCWVQSHGQLGY